MQQASRRKGITASCCKHGVAVGVCNFCEAETLHVEGQFLKALNKNAKGDDTNLKAGLLYEVD